MAMPIGQSKLKIEGDAEIVKNTLLLLFAYSFAYIAYKI